MMRKYIYILAGTTIIVFFLMAFLNLSVKKLNIVKNGFNRSPVRKEIYKLGIVQLNEQITDIAGTDNDNIYLVTQHPDKILVVDKNKHNVQAVHLNVDVTDKLRSNFTTVLHNHFLFIAGGNLPGIIQYNMQTGKALNFKTDRAFSRCAIVNSNFAVIRGFNKAFDDENLRKINLHTGTYTEENGITDKTTGGGFATDGMLHYDQHTNRIIFNHFYSNKIFFLDTNLYLLNQGRANDTFKTFTAQARAVKSKDGVLFSFTKPPTLLSLYSCVDNGNLFIYSRLKADNETAMQFRNNTIIDVYSIVSGRYAGSLYIPVENGKKMFKFKTLNDLLIALYDKEIIIYRISLNSLL